MVSHSTRTSRRSGVATVSAFAAVAAMVLLPASAAMATPPAGISAKLLWQRTVGKTDYVVREITIKPGGTTGWHWHDGTLYGVIKSGTLTHQMADCTTVETYRTGAGIVEQSGSDEVHRGVNVGTVPVVLDVLYVDPKGAPFAEDAADPGCPALR